MQRTLNFVLIGGVGAGKTCYLTAVGRQTIACDAPTSSYIDPIHKSLSVDVLPPPTNIDVFRKLNFEMKVDSQVLGFSIADYGGGFLESFASQDDKTAQMIDFEEYLKESEGIFIFLPYEEEYRSSSVESITKCIDGLIHIVAQNDPSLEKCLQQIPVIFVVSKWDLSPFSGNEDENTQAERYIKEDDHYVHLWDKINLIFSDVAVVPLSSLTASKEGVLTSLDSSKVMEPIRFAIDHAYKFFEERIQYHREHDNTVELLKFLNYRYDDLIGYKNGEFLPVYKEVESRLSEEIVIGLQKSKSKILNDYQSSVFSLFRSEKVIAEVNSTLDKNRSSANRKIVMVVIFAVCIIAVIWFWYGNHKAKEAATNLLSRSESLLQEDSAAIEQIRDARDKVLKLKPTMKQQEVVQRLTEKLNILDKGQSTWRVASAHARAVLDNKEPNIDLIDDRIDELSSMKTVVGIKGKYLGALTLLIEDLTAWRASVMKQQEFRDLLNDIKETPATDISTYILEDLDHIRTIIEITNAKNVFDITLSKIFKDYETDQLQRFMDDHAILEDYRIATALLGKLPEIYNKIPSDIFEYRRDLDLAGNVRHIQETLNNIERNMEEGLRAHVRFVTTHSNNRPLGFSCGIHEKIILKVADHIFKFQNRSDCKTLNDEISISWKDSFVVKPGKYDVMAKRFTGTSRVPYSKEVKGVFNISEEDMITLISKGFVSKVFDANTAYYMVKLIAE